MGIYRIDRKYYNNKILCKNISKRPINRKATFQGLGQLQKIRVAFIKSLW